jgi:hypothetical protein
VFTVQSYVAEAALEDCEFAPEDEVQQSYDRQEQQLGKVYSRRPLMQRCVCFSHQGFEISAGAIISFRHLREHCVGHW